MRGATPFWTSGQRFTQERKPKQRKAFWRNRAAAEWNNSRRAVYEAMRPIWTRRRKCGEWFEPKRSVA